jgi:WD40 repeat protein
MGWLTLRRLKRIGVSPASEAVQALLARVSQRLGLRRTVRVLASSLAQVPLVVGYLRPVILLPVSLLTNIPATQLEAILAHELAYIRRHDFVVNLLQVLVETLFFYHPAVWWLSRRIRVEREHCCDDLVVRVMDNPREYGRALIAVEELRGRSSVLSLGASDGSLLERIRRISGQPNRRTGLSACAGISLILCMVGIVSLMSLTSNSDVVAMDENKITDDPLPAGSTLRFGTSRFRHGIPVSSMSLSSDGKLVIVANDNHMQGGTRIFDLVSGRVVSTLGSGIEAAAISPDGLTIVTKQNFSVRVHELTTGKELRRYELPRAKSYSMNDWVVFTPEAADSGVVQILVTPDGSRVITRGQYSDVNIWDGTSGKHLRRFHAGWQQDLAMNPDGKFLVWPVADEKNRYPHPSIPNTIHDGSRIELYEIAADRIRDCFKGFKGDAGELMFTNDGQQLISAGNQDGVVRMWDFETGKQVRSFLAVPDAEKPQYRQVSRSVLSPDGKTLVVAYQPFDNSIIIDGNRVERLGGKLQLPRPIRVWDIASGKLKYELKEAYGALAFSPDGRFFLTGRRIWKTSTGERLGSLPESNTIRSLSFSRDGRYLATAVSGDLIRVWNVATWTKRNEFKGHRDDLTTVMFGPGQRIFSGSMDTTILAWDASPQ